MRGVGRIGLAVAAAVVVAASAGAGGGVVVREGIVVAPDLVEIRAFDT